MTDWTELTGGFCPEFIWDDSLVWDDAERWDEGPNWATQHTADPTDEV